MPDLKKAYLFGRNRYILDKKKALQEGYRIFRAWHSCGCCTVDMAFRTVHNARIQFEMPKFADTVRDDMGVIHDCINTGRGYREVVRKAPVSAVSRVVGPSLQPPVGIQSNPESAVQF